MHAKKLEPLAEEFAAFITASAAWVIDDAQNYIKLPYYRFLDRTTVVFDTDIELFFDADCTMRRTDIDQECSYPKFYRGEELKGQHNRFYDG